MTDLPAAIAAAPTCVTLNAIREHDPCTIGWQRLLAGLNKTGPDDEPLSLIRILDINGLDDAFWAMRALSDADMPKARLFAVACARDVQHLMADPRSIAALDVAERYANGLATEAELATAEATAWDAARAAARAARAAARAAARDAAEAAWAAEATARATAWATARDAARDAARAAAEAVEAAAREKQRAHFIRIFGGSND